MSKMCFFTLLVSVSVALSQTVATAVHPHNPPVRIPASGGNFSYTVEASNVDTVAVGFRLWTMYRMPGGSLQGPVYGPEPVALPGGWSAASSDLIQYVPESMPSGIGRDHHHR